MKSLHLFIPGLNFEDSSLKWLQHFKRYYKYPAGAIYEDQLLNIFGIQSSEKISLAALSALTDKLPYQQGYWLRADPIELKADLAAVYSLGNANLQFDPQELTLLHTELQELLKDHNIRLHVISSQRWYFQLTEEPRITTYVPNAILGKDISEYLLYGKDQQFWRRLLTEVQMLLHQSEVNILRQQQGKALINSLWLWGEGELPKKVNTSVVKIWSNEPLSCGLGRYLNIETLEVPTQLDEIISQLQVAGDYCCYYDKLHAYYLHDKKNKAQSIYEFLQEKFFPQLVRALKRNTINRIIFYPNDSHVYIIEKPHWWQWFK